jgi:hypothetical protein
VGEQVDLAQIDPLTLISTFAGQSIALRTEE